MLKNLAFAYNIYKERDEKLAYASDVFGDIMYDAN